MITNLTVTTAVAIAEKRATKRGASVFSGRPHTMLERTWFAVKSSSWIIMVSGFFEPVFYLAAFGFGLGQFVPQVSDGHGNMVSYAAFIAPALLATSAMNGAIYDSTWNVFFKMHFGKVYQAMMATSLGPLDIAVGEISWALIRGLAYAIGFTVVVWPMGLIPSAWGILAIPAAVLIAWGFASLGMGVTSYMKNFQQMNWVNFVLLPMFLFSGTFFPLSVYPQAMQYVIMSMPLWQAVEMIRALTLGNLSWSLLGHAAYFLVLVVLGMIFTTKRLTELFMR